MMESTELGFLFLSSFWDHMICNLVGIALALYALYVELKKSKDPKYVAMCDFNDKMSCSKALTSEYSKGFGMVQYLVGKDHFLNMPNCVTGIIFYTLQLTLSVINKPWATSVLFYSSVISCMGSVYLAYILFFVLNDICVVCMATYSVNGLLLYLNSSKFYHGV